MSGWDWSTMETIGQKREAALEKTFLGEHGHRLERPDDDFAFLYCVCNKTPLSKSVLLHNRKISSAKSASHSSTHTYILTSGLCTASPSPPPNPRQRAADDGPRDLTWDPRGSRGGRRLIGVRIGLRIGCKKNEFHSVTKMEEWITRIFGS